MTLVLLYFPFGSDQKKGDLTAVSVLHSIETAMTTLSILEKKIFMPVKYLMSYVTLYCGLVLRLGYIKRNACNAVYRI